MSFLDHLLSSSPSPAEGWKQKHFYFKEKILAVSTVSTSLGLFVTTQINFCNSSDTAFSTEKHRLHACTRMLICSHLAKSAYSYASSMSNVTQIALTESESLAPQRLSMILSIGLCRLWHLMCLQPTFIIYIHHIANYILTAHCPQWYSLVLLQVKNYLCPSIPNKPLITHEDILFFCVCTCIWSEICKSLYSSNVTTLLEFFFSAVLLKNKIFALPWWGSLVLAQGLSADVWNFNIPKLHSKNLAEIHARINPRYQPQKLPIRNWNYKTEELVLII